MFNKNNDNQTVRTLQKKWWIFLAIFFGIIIIAVGSSIAYQRAYAGKIFPGVRISYVEVGGQTQAAATERLKTIENNFQEKGFKFIYQDKEVIIEPVVVAVSDPDLAKEILAFDWKQTMENAYAVGRNGNVLQNVFEQLQATLIGKKVAISYQLDEKNLTESLRSAFGEFEQEPRDAGLIIEHDGYEITEEKTGFGFAYTNAIETLKTNIDRLQLDPIYLELQTLYPQIKKELIGSAANSLDRILNIDSIALTSPKKTWTIQKEMFVDWLEFQKQNNELTIGINKEKTVAFLQPIADEIHVEPRDAKFKLDGTKVTEFQASQDGTILKIDETYERINNAIITGHAQKIELVIDVEPAKIGTDDVNTFGITELVGRGTSNFAGSPKNRRHNITVGAASVNGTLIKPGEEFSLLKTLGVIDGTTGYLPELVIKGSRTIPEYGGGLCQIGTTAFRAALYSGLPITARKNHSYRVSYYEPPIGMDATIYDPAPDFKFLNDTENYLLFITRIEGDELIFELYGTKDGRSVHMTEPVVYNYTSPGEPRYIETTELAPGEKRKVESAHAGAEAEFTYTVTYPNGEVKEETFHSKYVAWKETWLVGIDPNAVSENPDGTPTTENQTPITTEEQQGANAASGSQI